MMETDALLTDVEDQLFEEIRDDYDHESAPILDIENTTLNDFVESEEEPVMEANNFVVVVHTQIMENIGTAVNPSWATAGTKVLLVQEGFTNYGEARAVATKVSTGEVPVELSEGAYVLGIDVMPTGEYRQFYEEVEAEETVEEDTTDDVFFAQQVMEAKKLAGIREGTYTNKGTPTVHETRARLEALSKGYFDALAEEAKVAEAAPVMVAGMSAGELAGVLRTIKETIKRNPRHNINKVIRAVCAERLGNPNLDEEIIKHAEFEYGSLDEFEAEARGRRMGPAPAITITKHS
jgi:hypothetical protein